MCVHITTQRSPVWSKWDLRTIIKQQHCWVRAAQVLFDRDCHTAHTMVYEGLGTQAHSPRLSLYIVPTIQQAWDSTADYSKILHFLWLWEPHIYYFGCTRLCHGNDRLLVISDIRVACLQLFFLHRRIYHCVLENLSVLYMNNGQWTGHIPEQARTQTRLFGFNFFIFQSRMDSPRRLQQVQFTWNVQPCFV